MSNICVLKASGLDVKCIELETQVKIKVDQIGCGVFFSNNGLFPNDKKENLFYCSFSDDYRFDNCEMLLLPDNCWINGKKTNCIPFYFRMEHLRSVIEIILDHCRDVELFVGDIGEYSIDEFQPFDVNLLSFASFMNQNFNKQYSRAMRLFLYK